MAQYGGANEPAPVYKVVVIGDSGTGKTSIVNRYIHNAFEESTKPTIAVDFAVKTVQVNDEQHVRLQVWDVAGQDRFSAMSNQFFRGARAAIVVFDGTHRTSFTSCARWREKVESEAPSDADVQMLYVLCENKHDLIDADESRSVVDDEERDALVDARTYADCYEVSAKTGDNVEAMFKYVAKELWTRYRLEWLAKLATDRDDDADGTVSLGEYSTNTRTYIEGKLVEHRRAKSSCAC